jgi:hypothetical protein
VSGLKEGEIRATTIADTYLGLDGVPGTFCIDESRLVTFPPARTVRHQCIRITSLRLDSRCITHPLMYILVIVMKWQSVIML